MKALIACEESQEITKAMRELGIEAYSCDIKECSGGHPEWHIQQDIIKVLEDSEWWDLIIMHPDCTAMALSGNRYYGNGMPRNDERIAAIKWTIKLWNLAKSKTDHAALENPKSVIFGYLGAAVQYLQPNQFGHNASKETGFALYGLPPLFPTSVISPPEYGCKCGYRFPAELGKYGCPNCEGESGPAKGVYANQTPSGQNNIGPSSDRKRIRAKTYPGIASAIAAQWGVLVAANKSLNTER